MLRLMLLRHAKSDWSTAGQRDHDRPLAARGRGAAPQIGTYMARHKLVPERIICSTAIRTRETWDLVGAALPKAPPATFERKLYDADPDDIVDVIRSAGRDVRRLLVLGHNPGLHETANLLVASGDLDARERLREKLPTAGLVVIDFAFGSWDKVHADSGRLDRFVVPRMLEAATD
jgi:phosphohistidine phosphatase